MKKLKEWQLTELKKLLKIKSESPRNDKYRITKTFEFSFPSFEIMEPVKLWKSAAQVVNDKLNNVEKGIRDLILCSSKKEWDSKKNNYL